MHHSLPLITYLAHDYDEAIDWFSRCLQFTLLEDTDQGRKRWVRMAPHPSAETVFLIAQASSAAQTATVGNQHGGRVGFFLKTDDFIRPRLRSRQRQSRTGPHITAAAAPTKARPSAQLRMSYGQDASLRTAF